MLDNDIPNEWIDENSSLIYNSDKIYSIALNGKILCFYIEVLRFSNTAEIISYSGYADGKLTTNSTYINSGKNIGKSNETSISEQAILEAKAILVKKQKEGYKNLKEIELRLIENNVLNIDISSNILTEYSKLVYNTDHNNRYQPMLAKPINWNKLPKLILWQRKYNGVRCRVHLENDNFILISREGEEFEINHIENELNSCIGLKELISNGDFLDGELYVHGLPLQDIVSLIKTPSNESLKLQYIVYDIGVKYFSNYSRNIFLNTFFDKNKQLENIKKAGTIIIENLNVQPVKEEILTLSKTAHIDGYEGGMVRNGHADYSFGFRPTGVLQKVKFDKSADFEIIGYTIPDSGILEDFCFKCKTKEDRIFEVKAHGTEKERLKIINNIENFICKKLQLSFYEWTKDKIPFHITSVVIRDYE